MTINLQKAKEFAERNKLPLACGVGVVVGAVVTRKVDTRLFAGFAYKSGAQAGILSAYLDHAYSYIESSGAWEEFLKHGPTLAETVTPA